jgi:ketosteroid isomerase-like protein
MSQENVEIVRRMFEAYLTGDAEAALAAIDPEIEWDLSAYPLPDWPETGRGREGYMLNLTGYLQGWRDYQTELRELIDAGDDVVVALHETVALRDSGAILDRDIYQVWTVHNAAIARFRVFKTREQALEAAGLRQ